MSTIMYHSDTYNLENKLTSEIIVPELHNRLRLIFC